MAYCVRCGKEVPDGSTYCPACGRPAANAAVARSGTSKGVWIAIGVGCLVLAPPAAGGPRAAESARKAHLWTWVAFGLGLLPWLFYGVVMVIAVMEETGCGLPHPLGQGLGGGRAPGGAE